MFWRHGRFWCMHRGRQTLKEISAYIRLSINSVGLFFQISAFSQIRGIGIIWAFLSSFWAVLSASKPGTSPFCRLFEVPSVPGTNMIHRSLCNMTAGQPFFIVVADCWAADYCGGSLREFPAFTPFLDCFNACGGQVCLQTLLQPINKEYLQACLEQNAGCSRWTWPVFKAGRSVCKVSPRLPWWVYWGDCLCSSFQRISMGRWHRYEYMTHKWHEKIWTSFF